MIYDTSDNPIFTFPFQIASGGALVFTIRVEGRTNAYLRSESVADLTVEARRTGTTDWTNLETTPIDLSAFTGTRVNYEIRLTAAVLSSRTVKNFKLSVS